MNIHIIKDYLKIRLPSIAITTLTFSLLLRYSTNAKNDWGIILVVFLIGFIQDYFQFKKKVLLLADLKEKGVSEEEFNTSAFLRNWEEKRKNGILKFTLIDGGVILAAVFLFIIGFGGFFIMISLSIPVEIGTLIGYSCLISALLGMSANLFLWSVNEKKFARLTNPLH